MPREESRTDLGLIRIHKNAVASVASLATSDIDGVKRIGRSFKTTLMELIGADASSAIKVEFTKNEEVRIEIPIFIKYGFNIPETANKIQENVRQALEKMTNLSIKDININVQGIERG